MRNTPFLDSRGVTLKPTVPDHAASIIDTALQHIERGIDWGTYEGRRRKPCHGQPMLLAGMPIGQYHCPFCVDMQIAGMPHLPPDDDYESVTGRWWPAGYEEPDADG